MDHPPAVLDKARRMECLVLRVEAGESLSQVCADLDLKIKATDLLRLRAKYEKGERTWEALIDGRYGHPQTAHSALREWMYERKREDETLTASQLAKKVKDQFGVKLDPGHINRLRRAAQSGSDTSSWSTARPGSGKRRSRTRAARPVTGRRRSFFPWKQRSKRWGSPRVLSTVWRQPARSTGRQIQESRCGWR